MRLLRHLDDEDRVAEGTIATTYTFGPRFFESQVLSALTDRHEASNTVVLIDADTYDRTLTETTETTDPAVGQGLRAVGRRYYLAPVAVDNGIFHPKIVFQAGEKRANGIVGSANLTQSGYTSNREIVTTSATEAAAPNPQSAALLAECRDYLIALQTQISTDRWSSIIVDRYEAILSASDWLAEYEDGVERSTWVLHNLDAPLVEQLLAQIDSDGAQIEAIHVIAPFYGTGLAVPRWFTDEGIDTTLYLQDGQTQINSEALDDWIKSPTATALRLEADRYVHGKLLYVQTDCGAYALTGSANASASALLRTAPPTEAPAGNHELGILRRVDDPTHFEYLLAEEALRANGQIDPGSFRSGRLTEFIDSDDGDIAESIPIGTPTVSFYQRSHGASRVTVTTTIDSDQIDPQRTTLRLELTPAEGDGVETIPLYPGDRSRRQPSVTEADSHDRDRRMQYTKAVHSSDIHGILREACRARLTVGNPDGDTVATPYQWVATSSPANTDEANGSARAGTDTVPQTLMDLFVGDDVERKEAILDSFNGIIRGLKTGPIDIDTDENEHEDEPTTDPGGTEGIRVRNWEDASRSSSVKSSIVTYYEQWLEDMTKLQEIRADPDAGFDAVAARLRAINQCNMQLLALADHMDESDKEESNLPTNLPIEVTNTLYTKTDLRGGSGHGSRLHWFLQRGTTVAQHDKTDKQDITAETIYTWCQEDFLPNIIFGHLVVRLQHAGNVEAYERYFGNAFEELALECFPDAEAYARWATGDSLELAITAVKELIEPVVAHFERYGIENWIPYELRHEDRLEEVVVRFLGCTLAAAEVIEEYEQLPEKDIQLLQYARNHEDT